SSLIHHDPDRGVVFMHRWTATELRLRWQPATGGLTRGEDLVTAAHQGAATWWRWRVDVWPQDRRADGHARLEARHHLLPAGEWDEANTITEHICSQLHQWGAWEQETNLIHDTLRWLPSTSARQSAWYHQLGILAQARGDYAEAQRRYQQSLTIL